MKKSYTVDDIYNFLVNDEKILKRYLMLCAKIAAKNENLKQGDCVEFSHEYVDGKTLNVKIEIV